MSIRQRPSPSNPPSTSPSPSVTPTPPPLPRGALSQALESTAHLANLLPTGTLLAFQLLTPIFTNNGVCDAATRPMTAALLVILALSCFLACFTDSIKSLDGQIYYGFATVKGLWLFDNTAATAAGPLPDLSKYRLSFIDAVHAVSSVLVFVSVALRDKNVTSCFYPTPGHEAQEVLDIGPIGIGLICSLLFVIFPTRRHGIGYPVTRD
ncbi:unnamed protein product [Fraxinus pennsylvanica]|uniref:Uncharacterized protein n=1 Tax=Fraxinus pennsylvanica TaxID=56036 RepID=A0AAD2DZ43_9LAMI|nr:unnamed protein product [Fraxinus pennsylvanica]